jgi:hypothetical protein
MRMGFDPKMNADDFRTVWTAGSGWGTYAQKAEAGKGMTVSLDVQAGAVRLQEFDLRIPDGIGAKPVRSLKAALGGAPAAASTRREGSTLRVFLTRPLTIAPGQPLTLAVQF